MTRGELRFCPECRQRWPRGAEFDVRSFRWLDDLPRSVSPSNIDCVIHDGVNGRDRFLVFETKRAGEALEVGQGWLLKSIAAVSPERLIVRVLSGDAQHLVIHKVLRGRIDETGTPTTTELVRAAVVRWLGGALWSDCESGISRPMPSRVTDGHLCKWYREANGEFICEDCGRVYSDPRASSLLT